VPDARIAEYAELRRRLQERFRAVRAKYANHMRCAQGCALCCHGLFDVSVPDALLIARGFRALPAPVRVEVVQKATAIQEKLSGPAGFEPPYLLDGFSAGQIDALVESAGEVRCPFLDDRNACLIYAFRPLQCLLEGIPMVDFKDGLFGDWCELNFVDGVSARMAEDLRLDYYEIREVEQDLTVFVPSAICAAEYWTR
jgi:Fe-S-cluster containining protein